MLKNLTRSRGLQVCLAALLAALIPGFASAAGSEANVVLSFTQQDQIYLYISLALGFIAIAAGLFIKQKVLATSPGDEKMQEVGGAIHQGALAYLGQQVRAMLPFVVIIAIILAVIYSQTYSSMNLGILTAVSFIAGVGASYLAGWIGMDMAVRGNMRTAHAALTSYKKSLEIAFQSGAVAGMFTVGLGLIGATLIFLLAKENAMKLLVGFGFGGSLAALFMRVGGGIFTKAADVGADLVGKVEAGIPEDDPRNPATIADNVGDNVGDCAGMAADIFESYEVTLVAAIVLGAATSQIFDQQTWMKLILFALMARGVGILASIFGVFSVKGSDDLNSDPLKSIRKGFYVSAAIAALGTGVVAYMMMSGIKTGVIKSRNQAIYDVATKIHEVRDAYASKNSKKKWEVTGENIKNDPAIVALGIPAANLDAILSGVIQAPAEEIERLKQSLSGYHAVSLDSPRLKNYSVRRTDNNAASPMTTPQANYLEFSEAVKNTRLYKVKSTPAENAPVGPDGKKPVPQEVYFLSGSKAALDQEIASASATGSKFEVMDPKDGFKPTYYLNKDDKLVVGVPLAAKDIMFNFSDRTSGDSIYSMSKTELEKILKAREDRAEEIRKGFDELGQLNQKAQAEKDPAKKAALDKQVTEKQAAVDALQKEISNVATPMPETPVIAAVESREVPWYMFFGCIVFGILMAFAIEYLTDYYVSTHKKPTKEVAGVASAGPAPMIIQGFAYGLESSVFSVFAIVVALIVPLIMFNPALYGGPILSFYGIALVGLGLLTTTGYILAMDTFGPISDNAQGVFEMSGAGHNSKDGGKIVQHLDAAGNTTKALTKGFAIATAVVAAVALFHSFVEDAQLTLVGMRLEVPEIFLGLLIGAAAPYLFSAFAINAVGRASFELINEVRRQFRNDPGIMAGTSKPNYAACVSIVTAAAQKELLGPGILAIALPVAVAFGFGIGNPLTGAQALGGFLVGCIASGQLMAVLLANSGGMWDNAKKIIEDGLHGGKGTEAHKAAVVCDTVGDPFKDTAGPALNPLIKVMNLVALLIAPVVISKDVSDMTRIIVTVVCLAALAFSIWWSKRGSMSTGLADAAKEESAVKSASLSSGEAEAPEKPKNRITVDD